MIGGDGGVRRMTTRDDNNRRRDDGALSFTLLITVFSGRSSFFPLSSKFLFTNKGWRIQNQGPP
jgi:hypothetical protein